MSERKEYKVPAVMKALSILEHLGKKEEVSFTDIHTQLGIPKSSAYQIINTLISQGYLRQADGSNRYFFGLKLIELGQIAANQLDIRREAKPVLRNLVLITNFTCHLGILDGRECVYILKIEGDQFVRMNSWEGKRIPLHSSAIGKVLLAWRSEAFTDEILKKTTLVAFTENTISEPAKLRRELVEVKRRGWALDNQENERHIRCVGAPVTDISGNVIAAISISALATQLNDDYLPEAVELTQGAARQLSIKMGDSDLKPTGSSRSIRG